MNRKTFLILLTIAAAMRIFMIGRAPLWYDENFTLILARLPFAQMMQATAGDVHPPLWYIVEWILFHAFPSLPAYGIRIPALTFSLLAFVMFVQLCYVLNIPERVTIAASVLMAILPMQLWYAQEGRMYAMLEFLVLATLYAGYTRRWIWFAVASVAMLYTQNYGMFYLAVIGLVLLITDWKSRTDIVQYASMAVVVYLPWVFVIAGQMQEINGRYWIMDISAGAVLKTLYMQFWSSSMLTPGVVPSYVVTFVLLIIGAYVVISTKPENWLIVVTMAFAPVALAWLVSLVWQPLLLFRPLIGISPFLYLIICWPIGQWWQGYSLFGSYRDNRLLYTACFIVPLLMLGIGGYFVNVANMKGEGAVSPLLNALTYVRANWHEGDVIYYTDDGPMINIMPYAADLPEYRMPACAEKTGYAPVLGSLVDPTRAAMNVRIAELGDVAHQRAWVFAPRSPLHPLCYEEQISTIAPEGGQLITVDDNQYLTSGIWLVEKK